MQYEHLNTFPTYIEDMFDEQTGRRLKHKKIIATISAQNTDKDYKHMNIFHKYNLKYWKDYVETNINIKCKYKNQGHNFLINHLCVKRKSLHRNYTPYLAK